MQKMKTALESQDINRVATFQLKNTSLNMNNFNAGSGSNHSRFAAAKQKFCGNQNSETMKKLENKPIRKDVKKRADIKKTFHE